MHFFKVPKATLLARGYTSPRVDDTDFLGTIIGCEETGYLNSAWGIHIWLLNNSPVLQKRGDPFRLDRDLLEKLKAKLEAARDEAHIVPTGVTPDPNNLVRRYKEAWKAGNPEGLKKHFPYSFDNIVAGDVMQGLEIVNNILDTTDFDTTEIWYYPFY